MLPQNCNATKSVYQKALIRTFHNNFDNKNTVVNSQHEKINLKGNFVHKKTVLKVLLFLFHDKYELKVY